MRGRERQEAGVTPAQLMEEGFRAGWAREYPGQPLPEETLRLSAQWATKPAKPYQMEPARPQRAQTAVTASDEQADDDPFAENYRPRRQRIDPDGLALAEDEVRARLAAAAAKRAEQEGAGPAGQFFATMEVEG